MSTLSSGFRNTGRPVGWLLLGAALLLTIGNSRAADAPGATAAELASLRVGLDTAWVLLAAMLVFFMNAGFAMLESGLCQAKNCVNILAKNVIVFAASSVSFWVIGWGLMFGDGSLFSGSAFPLFVGGSDTSPATPANGYEGVYGAIAWAGIPLWAKFFFNLVFAATAATIVSGVVAERVRFHGFLIFSFLLVAFIYPVSGHWVWGGGLLADAEAGWGRMLDFAGSTVVHSVGGWAALAGVIVLGPRAAKYREGRVFPIPGHNMTSATLGVFILWLGWFGFNPGSTLAVGDGSAIAHILVATNLSAAMGALAATLTSWILLHKPDLTMILNGVLAGLVSITASCAFVGIGSAAVIGFIGGILVVLAVIYFDKVKLDDPVGALSVHLVCGIWGTLSAGLFLNATIATTVGGLSEESLLSPLAQTWVQLKGIVLVGIWAFTLSLLLWLMLKYTIGIRVSADEEREGLDLGEHGNEAYPDFGRTVK